MQSCPRLITRNKTHDKNIKTTTAQLGGGFMVKLHKVHGIDIYFNTDVGGCFNLAQPMRHNWL